MADHSAATSSSEPKARTDAERRGTPLLVYRDGGGEQQVVVLEELGSPFTVGRGAAADIRLDWDAEVSRLHAEFARAGEDWTLVDDGLSRNGSYVNGERLSGRRRLQDGDSLRFGVTAMLYRASRNREPATVTASSLPTRMGLSEAQRRVLTALCRPYKYARAYATPATNQQIADELYLSVDAVKTHLRALFQKFGVEELPQNQKRARLVERALQGGLVSERDL